VGPPSCFHAVLSPVPSLLPAEIERLFLEFYSLRSKQGFEWFGEKVFSEHGHPSRLLFYDEYSHQFLFLFFQGHDYPTWLGYHFTKSIELHNAVFSVAIHRDSVTRIWSQEVSQTKTPVPLRSRLGFKNVCVCVCVCVCVRERERERERKRERERERKCVYMCKMNDGNRKTRAHSKEVLEQTQKLKVIKKDSKDLYYLF